MLRAMSKQPSIEAREGAALAIPRSLKELLAARLDWTARYGLIVAALTTVATIIGVALSPYLLAQHPIVLVLLSPIPRHMLLVAPSIELPTYLMVGGARWLLAMSGALCLGLRFGEAGISWAEQQGDRLKRGVMFLRVGFRRAGLFVVFVAPYPFVAAAAVAIGASVWRVVVVASAGHLGWLLIWYRFGDLASEWIAPVTEFFRRYTWESTLVCVVVVGAYYLRKLMRRPVVVAPAPRPSDDSH